MLNIKKLTRGFTMIELLIVIAVLGILAVAVLSAINPIEQINRSRDTGSRSDAEQLVSAIDRYYASMGYYPWKTGPTSGTDTLEFTRITAYEVWKEQVDGGVPVLSKLDGTQAATETTGELKNSFTSRITSPGYNHLFVYNAGTAGSSTYVCFNGLSNQFQTEAKNRCTGTVGAIPDDLDEDEVCGTDDGGVAVDTKTGQYLTCLP